MGTESAIVSTLMQNEDYVSVLKDAISIEEGDGSSKPFRDGWDYSEISETPQTLSKMVQEGLLDIASRRSSGPNTYQISNISQAKQAITLIEEGGSIGEEVESEDGEESKEEMPDDLFEVVIGHDPVKDLLHRCINTEEQTHFRLQGESSTAKSLFLTEIERLPNSKYRSASGMTEAGLLDILIEQQPKYLLFDEIDKADNDCYTPLYELTEHGRIQKTISGRDINIELNCNLIVTLNHPERLPQELKNRMIRLEFEEYEDSQYIEVVTSVLQDNFGLDEEVAQFIAEYQLEELGVKNVREPEQIAKLAENDLDDVERVIENIEEYR
jgi:hypothetical protein